VGPGFTRLGSRTLGWGRLHVAGGGPLVSFSLSLLRRTCSRVVHLGVRVRDPAGVSGRFNLVFIRVTGASWRWWAPASTPRVPEAEGEATGRVQIPLQNLPHPVRQSASALSALPVAGLPLPCRAHGSQFSFGNWPPPLLSQWQGHLLLALLKWIRR